MPMPSQPVSHMTRRQFTRATAGAFAASALVPMLPKALAHQAAPLNWRRIDQSARVIEGMGGNGLIFASAGEVLLVDTKVSGVGKIARGFVESADFKVTQVINTHHHADHTGGNFAWSADTPILAHEIAKDRVLKQHTAYAGSMKRMAPNDQVPPIKAFAPTSTTDGNTELDIGDHKVVLHHFGPGHTDNDVVVQIPKANIIHAGDLLFNKMHIFVDLKGGVSSEGWMNNVDAVIKLCDASTTVIAGHGPVTNIRGLEQQRDYIRTLRETVESAIKDGKSKDETIRMTIPGAEDYASPRGLPYALREIYTEMTS